MKSTNQSRRSFLGAASLAGTALATGSIAANQASAAGSGIGRKVMGQSPSPLYSQAVAFDRLIFVAGVVGQKPGGGEPISPNFEVQCRQALENLKASVRASGSTMANVLKCTCFLTDGADFPTMNKVYRSFFPDAPPARSTVVVRELVVPGAKLEIDCVTCLK